MPTNESPFLTATEAAEWLRVSVQTLSEYRRRGAGPRYYQPEGAGTRVFYRLSDLEDWMESGAAARELDGADVGLETAEIDTEGDTNAGAI